MVRRYQGSTHRSEEHRVATRPEDGLGLDVSRTPSRQGQPNRDVDGHHFSVRDGIGKSLDFREVASLRPLPSRSATAIHPPLHASTPTTAMAHVFTSQGETHCPRGMPRTSARGTGRKKPSRHQGLFRQFSSPHDHAADALPACSVTGSGSEVSRPDEIRLSFEDPAVEWTAPRLCPWT